MGGFADVYLRVTIRGCLNVPFAKPSPRDLVRGGVLNRRHETPRSARLFVTLTIPWVGRVPLQKEPTLSVWEDNVEEARQDLPEHLTDMEELVGESGVE